MVGGPLPGAGNQTHTYAGQGRNIRDPAAVEAIFVLYKPTHVIHLAAKVGGLFANAPLPEDA